MANLPRSGFVFSGFPWVSRRPWPFNHESSSRIVVPVVKVFGSSSWKRTGTETCKDFIRFLEWLLGTLPKMNGLPRKTGQAPEGNDRIPSIHFQVRTVSFREGRSWDVYAMQIQEIAEIHIFLFSFCSRRGFEGVSWWRLLIYFILSSRWFSFGKEDRGPFRWRKIEVNKGYFERGSRWNLWRLQVVGSISLNR